MLGDVLGLVLITQDAQDITVDVVLVADIQEPDRVHITGLRPRHGTSDGRITVVLLQRRARPKTVKACSHALQATSYQLL